MRIGELSGRTGVSAKAIRFYEEFGVLPEPRRAPNGYRDYDEDMVQRLRFVKDAQATRLSLTEIGTILDMRDRGDATCRHTLHLLEERLKDIGSQIRALEHTRIALTSLVERARRLDPADCTDPNRCQTIAAAPVSTPAIGAVARVNN
ncbi:MAG TPA: MerR family transcriptional regulator [Acidimicrobiia bacterium]|nr:MerR family transcriptional regulator [Acidimicrobiia bacterium]